jgi:DNA-binding NarL/FixJ family response regulator
LFIVDDHILMREHLTALLAREPDLEFCGQAAHGRSALAMICKQEPDLVIMDHSLKDGRGLDFLKSLHELKPKLPVLVLSMHDETFYVQPALQAGARGYITKEEAPTRILFAVRQVLAGRHYLSPQVAERLGLEGESKERTLLCKERTRL